MTCLVTWFEPRKSRQASLCPPQLSPSLLPLLCQLATCCSQCSAPTTMCSGPSGPQRQCQWLQPPDVFSTTNTPSTANASSTTKRVPPFVQPLSPPFKCSVTLTPNAQVSLKLPSTLLLQLLIDPVNWTPHAQACPTSSSKVASNKTTAHVLLVPPTCWVCHFECRVCYTS